MQQMEDIRYLNNEVIWIDLGDLLYIFESYVFAWKKYRCELNLF